MLQLALTPDPQKSLETTFQRFHIFFYFYIRAGTARPAIHARLRHLSRRRRRRVVQATPSRACMPYKVTVSQCVTFFPASLLAQIPAYLLLSAHSHLYVTRRDAQRGVVHELLPVRSHAEQLHEDLVAPLQNPPLLLHHL